MGLDYESRKIITIGIDLFELIPARSSCLENESLIAADTKARGRGKDVTQSVDHEKKLAISLLRVVLINIFYVAGPFHTFSLKSSLDPIRSDICHFKPLQDLSVLTK